MKKEDKHGSSVRGRSAKELIARALDRGALLLYRNVRYKGR